MEGSDRRLADWKTPQNVEMRRRELRQLLPGWLSRKRWAGRNIERTIIAYIILERTTKDKRPLETFGRIILKWILTNWDTKFWTWSMSFRSVHWHAVWNSVTGLDVLSKTENLWIRWALRAYPIRTLLHGVYHAQWHQPMTAPQEICFFCCREFLLNTGTCVERSSDTVTDRIPFYPGSV